ncbi:MAG: NAD+ synthase [Elusimicrobiales bacterium]|nr:NAD+ synthase [Elusimicrobiales bacterium]
MKIGLAHINLTYGDIEGNIKKAIEIYNNASQAGCDIVIYPELTTTGYVCGDLFEYNWFIKKNLKALENFISITNDKTAAVLGYVDLNKQGWGKPIKNAAAFIYNKKIITKVYKKILPYSGIFYEQRYFEPDISKPKIINFKNKKILITICADIWHNTDILSCPRLTFRSPLDCCERYDTIINLSASPYYFGKIEKKIETLNKISRQRKINIAYVNICGSNDQIVFDGTSFYITYNGKLFYSEPFCDGLTIIDENSKKNKIKMKEDISFIKKAIIVGIRDFFKKQNLEKAVIGLSGGIDSAVVACLSVEALGNNNVLGMSLPSKFTSKQSIDDAVELAKKLHIDFKIIPINKIYNSYLNTLKLNDKEVDLTIQNIQARIRANILMSYSNKYGYILVNTSNKSEIATGYSTMYGDSCGAISPIGDVLKTDIYKIAHLINQENKIIPKSIIDRIPTAELKPNQTDQDDLPPYDFLDEIIKLYIEEKKDPKQIIKKLGNKEKVISIIKRIENNQYKRKQMPPIIKVSKNSFDDERRIPIVKKINL